MATPLRTLLVDDSDVDAELVLLELQRSGYAPQWQRVDTAEALEAALAGGEWDAITCDYVMPQFSGPQALQLVRRLGLDLPFIVISGKVDEETAVEMMKAGAHDFIAKGRLSRLGPAMVREVAEAKIRQRHREVEEALRLSEARFRALMENSSDLILLVDALGIVRYASPALQAIGGMAPAEVVGNSIAAYVHPQDQEALQADLRLVLEQPHVPHAAERRYRHRDGSWLVLATIAKNALDDPAVQGIVINVRDVSERRRQEERIARLARVREVLSGINAIMVRAADRDALFRETCRLVVGAAGFRMAWVGLVDATCRRIEPVAWQGAPDGFFAAAARCLEFEPGASGRRFAARIARRRPAVLTEAEATACLAGAGATGPTAVLPVVLDRRCAAVLVVHAVPGYEFDADELQLLGELAGEVSFALSHIARQAHGEYLALHDPVTGLANRALLHERLQQRISNADGGTVPLALFEVEGFQDVNETLGWRGADELLRTLAQRISAHGGSAEVARGEAGTFAVTGHRNVTPAEAAQGAGRLMEACFDPPVTIAGTQLRLAAHCGIAIHPADGADAPLLYRNASAALSRARASGDRVVFYAPEMNANVARRLAIETRLRQAVDLQQFELHYQPKVDTRTRSLVGLEALLRWHDPERGLIGPAEFVPLLEESGLIVPVGHWTLQAALDQHRRWQAAGLAPPPIAVNASAVELRRSDYVGQLRQVLGAVPDSPIDLEVTESAIMGDVEENILLLRAIRELGVRIAVDDFGTGYSSLAYIARLPVDLLKIDRSFVAAMATSPQDMAIVSTVVALAHQLDLEVVAEGVDSEEQAKLLRLLKCDQMQGYLLGRPQSADQVAALLPAARPIAEKERP